MESQDLRNEARLNYLLVCLVVAANQAPDFLISAGIDFYQSSHYAIPYMKAFMIDLLSLVMVFVLCSHRDIPTYAKVIISIQAISLTNHAIMLGMNVLIRYWPHDVVGIVHLFYQPALEAAFYYKVLALFWGGHGILNSDSSSGDVFDIDGASADGGLASRRSDLRTQIDSKNYAAPRT